MKLKLRWMILILALATQGATTFAQAMYRPALEPTHEQAQAAHLAAELLARHHYRKLPIDTDLSQKVFERYLKSLDPEKLFFLQSDIDQWSGDRTKLTDAVVNEDLSIPFAIFNRYGQRAAERFAYARTLLKKGFDFRINESYQYSREKAAWPTTEAQMHDLWRKRVKNDWLRLKLAGRDDKSIAKILDKRYDNLEKRFGKTTSADAFQVFMNAYTTAIEPHTNYMGPKAAEEFDIAMRLSLVGIGAVLTEKDDYAMIRELVPGGPAALSGKLKMGDRIAGVAQGQDGVMTDVVGWRLDDTVELIRGAPDTVVVLDVIPADVGPDGKHKLVSLVRKTISLEKQSAKASVHSVMAGKSIRRIGVIDLPSFYEDFTARRKGVKDYKSATHDVARLLEDLKKQKVDGVLMDLRNNGGGSLTEAIDLTGLFIGKGPVVQQRNTRGRITVESNTRASVVWNGPLGVLINRGSASASEIFAAAIQDYGRGLIIGEPSFGKGTVQGIIDLDQVANHDKPQFGEVRMTIAQFFRINGGTTQLRGVTPDFRLPGLFDAQNFGESSYDNALPWSQVKPANYLPADNLQSILPTLLARHEARVKKDKDFQNLIEDIAEARRQRETNLVSLNEAERRKERDAQERRRAAREAQRTTSNSASKKLPGNASLAGPDHALRDDGLQPDERNLANQLAVETAAKDAKDILLLEAVNIVGDAVAVLDARGTLAGPVRADLRLIAK